MAGKTAQKAPEHKKPSRWQPRTCQICEQPITEAKDALRVLRLSYPEDRVRRYRFWGHRGCVR